MTPESPFARAAIRDGIITLHPWSPRLIRGGPRAAALDGVSAALADLSCTDDNELIVTPIRPMRLDDVARAALTAWAMMVGYQRMWLPGQVIALDDHPATLGRATVRCPTCGARWQDDQLEFWQHVRAHGGFPGRCMACGGMLPEWMLDNDTPTLDPPGCHAQPAWRSKQSPGVA